jgi:hypothetical protein
MKSACTRLKGRFLRTSEFAFSSATDEEMAVEGAVGAKFGTAVGEDVRVPPIRSMNYKSSPRYRGYIYLLRGSRRWWRARATDAAVRCLSGRYRRVLRGHQKDENRREKTPLKKRRVGQKVLF